MTVKDFGKRIKDRRVMLGIDQQVLANDLGVSRTMIGKLERGERDTLPSRDQINVIAKRLETKAEFLVGGNEFFMERYTEEEQELLKDEESTDYIRVALAKLRKDRADKEAARNAKFKMDLYTGRA